MDKNRKIIISLIIVITVLVIILAGVVIYFTLIEETEKKQPQQSNNNSTDYDLDIDENTNNIAEEVKAIEIQTFNAAFEIYEGTEMSGVQIKSLFALIEENNQTIANEHIVELDTTGLTNSEEIDNTKKYTAELFKDEEGYINKVKITENIGTEISSGEVDEQPRGDIEQLIFNSKFTPYEGEINGPKLYELLQLILNNNATNVEHQISYTSNNVSELSEFLETDKYLITITYNETGYISNINLDKIF